MTSNPIKFCKIIDQELTETLRLPKKFATKWGEQLPKKEVYLKVPNGRLWPVDVTYSKSDNEVCLQKGWSAFRRHYSFGPGYYLEFNYNGVARFDVIIFDRTGSEIQYKPSHISPTYLADTADQTPDDPIRFCQIIEDPKCDRLRVPKTFTQRYGADLPQSAFVHVLGGTSRTMWEVKLVTAKDGEIYIMGGRWNEFRDYYDICFGHSVVMEFLGKYGLFDVWIYDGTGTEKDMISAFRFNLDDLHVEGYDSDKDTSVLKEDHHQEDIRTSVGMEESYDSSDDSVYLADRIPARRVNLGGTKADGKTAKHARARRNSHGGIDHATLSFTKEIKASNKYRVDFPRGFARAIVDKPGSVCLKNELGRKWYVQMSKTGPNQYSMTSGWNDFLIGNNVVVGSTISFVLTSRNTLYTHVVKVGDDSRALFKFVQKKGSKFELCMPAQSSGQKAKRRRLVSDYSSDSL